MNKGLDLKVPVSGQVIDEREKEAAKRVIDSGQFASYKLTEQFEHEFSSYIGKRYGVFVNSGSSANLLAVSAWKEINAPLIWGMHVIMPALNFPTTVNAIIQTGRPIRLRDVDIETLLPDKRSIYGAMTLGNYHDGYIVEDSCDAMWPGKYTGLMQTFSFFPAHHMTTGEGGMITTDEPELYRTLKSLRDWGRDCWCLPGHDDTCGKRFAGGYDHKYTYSRIGYNLKATEMQAAIGLEQLKKLPAFTQTRIRNFNYLYEKLKVFEDYFILPKSVLPDTPWFGFPLTIKDARFSRQDIMMFLHNKGVGCRTIFAGNITRQPAYKDVKFIIDEPLTNTDKIHNDSFWVGSWHGLSFDQLDYTVSMIQEFLERVDYVRSL